MNRAEIDQHRLLVPAVRSRTFWRGTDSAKSSRVNLFDIDIENTTISAASAQWVEAAKAGRRLRAVFANAHVINEMSAAPGYRAVVASADRVYADGSGMAIAARLAGLQLADNVNGTDLFPRLAADAKTSGVKIFMLGGKPGVAESARKRMVGFGLGEAIVGTHHGYFRQGSAEEDEAIMSANSSGAEILLVAMGVPLQDEWIARHQHRLTARVLVGVGGLFDYFAGEVSRAPHVWRAVGLEWVWRLMQEPRRMARRYLIGNVEFLLLAAAEGVRSRLAELPLPLPGRRQQARRLATR